MILHDSREFSTIPLWNSRKTTVKSTKNLSSYVNGLGTLSFRKIWRRYCFELSLFRKQSLQVSWGQNLKELLIISKKRTLEWKGSVDKQTVIIGRREKNIYGIGTPCPSIYTWIKTVAEKQKNFVDRAVEEETHVLLNKLYWCDSIYVHSRVSWDKAVKMLRTYSNLIIKKFPVLFFTLTVCQVIPHILNFFDKIAINGTVAWEWDWLRVKLLDGPVILEELLRVLKSFLLLIFFYIFRNVKRPLRGNRTETAWFLPIAAGKCS